jgi:hypothetical protein
LSQPQEVRSADQLISMAEALSRQNRLVQRRGSEVEVNPVGPKSGYRIERLETARVPLRHSVGHAEAQTLAFADQAGCVSVRSKTDGDNMPRPAPALPART